MTGVTRHAALFRTDAAQLLFKIGALGLSGEAIFNRLSSPSPLERDLG